MSNDPKFDEAKQLIDKFADQLLVLNGGKAISRTWKNHLLKALRPAPKKRGRKTDYAMIAAISKEVTLNRSRLAPPDRTSKDKRGKIKKAIADKHKISLRTVERIAEQRRQFLNDKPLDEKKRRALTDGIAAAIGDSLKTKHEAELSVKREAIRRKYSIWRFSDWVKWAPDNFEPHNASYFDNRRVETKKDLRKLIAEMKKARNSGR